MNKARLARFGLTYCALVWGSTFFLIKAALESVHPIALVAYRFLLAAALMVPLVRGRPLLSLLPRSAVLAACLIVLFVTQTLALQWISAANSGFITGLFILFVPFFGLLFFRERQGPLQWLAVTIALLGLWLLTGGIGGIGAGDALTLVCAAAYAIHLLLVDRFVKSDDTIVLAFHQFWMVGLVCLGIVLVGGYPVGVGSANAWWIIAFLALVPTVSGFLTQMVSQRHVPPLQTVLILSLEPVFAAAFAWGIGGEWPTISGACGGALIVAATILSEVARLRMLGKRWGGTPALDKGESTPA